jgi:hypothetical protein
MRGAFGMARKKRKKIAGPSVRFLLACRRGMHVDQRVVRDIGERKNYLERTEFEFFESSQTSVPVPDSFMQTEEVECPFCHRNVKIEVAGPVLVALRRFALCLWAVGFAPLFILPCLIIPEILKWSEKHAGGPYRVAGYVALGFGVLLLLCGLLSLVSWSSLGHRVRTNDFKHHLRPVEEVEQSEDEE